VQISFYLQAGLDDLMDVLGHEIRFVKNHYHFALLLILHAVNAHRVGQITKFAIVNFVSERSIFKPAISIWTFVNVEKKAAVINY